MKIRQSLLGAFRTFEELAALETDECVIWPFSTNGRYGQLWVSMPYRRVNVHREALLRRNPEPFPGAEAAHRPGCPPTCLNYRHLRWATRRENEADKVLAGVHQFGERNPSNKLTVRQVLRIRDLYASGNHTQQELAEQFGVTFQNISTIVNRKTWAWLP